MSNKGTCPSCPAINYWFDSPKGWKGSCWSCKTPLMAITGETEEVDGHFIAGLPRLMADDSRPLPDLTKENPKAEALGVPSS